MSLNAVVSKEDKLKNHIIDLQLAFNEFDKLGDGVNGKITVDKLGQILRTQLVRVGINLK